MLTTVAEPEIRPPAGCFQRTEPEEPIIEQAIATHELQLAGLQGQVTNPTALAAISQARDRAVAALQAAEKTGPNDKNGNPSPSPNGGRGQGGPSTSPHPTPKH